MPAAGGRQRDSLQVLPVFSTRVKAEVLMQRFLKLCRRGRIGRKSPALDTGSGAAALLTVASLPLLLLTLSRLGAPLWCHNCLQALFADWYFASVGSSVLCAKCILGHPPLPKPSHRYPGSTDWEPFPQLLHFCGTTQPLWMEGEVWSHRS